MAFHGTAKRFDRVRVRETMIYRGLLFLLAVFSLSAGAQQRSRFDLWDRNKDGKLTKEELPPNAQRNFERVDTDKSGGISLEEHNAFTKQRPQPQKGNPKEAQPVGTAEKIPDIDYAGDGNPRQTLDLYLPKERAEDAAPLPLVVFIHGGGWQNGNKSGGGRKVAEFVASGEYAGASIGYRLSGEAQWPAQIHDCKAAIRWLKANAKKYHLDPDRIAVWGTSAGGHLVAMLGVSQNVEGLEGDIGEHTDQSSSVKCVVNFFGPSELLTMGDHPSKIDHNAPNSPESKLIGGVVPDNPEKAKSASPTTHASKDDAPTLIVHGTEDPAVPYPQSTALKKKLEEVGVPAVLLTVKGGGHGTGFGPSVNEAVKTYLENQLLGKEKTVSDGTVEAGK